MTMADVRALLKAKRQEARIVHSLATYTQNGQLRCNACNTLVKHASAWEGHLGSKAHRTNVTRMRDEERLREEQNKQEELEVMGIDEDVGDKRKLGYQLNDEELVSKKPRVDKLVGPGIPADFFSDPSRAPLLPHSGGSDGQGPSKPSSAVEMRPTPSNPSELDAEWERFQREVVNVPDYQETYQRATIVAEPQINETLQGLPLQPSANTELNQLLEDEETIKRRRAQEDRELIMDRLLDEERAQEEADMKVAMLKNKFGTLKKRREAAKAMKAKQ